MRKRSAHFVMAKGGVAVLALVAVAAGLAGCAGEPDKTEAAKVEPVKTYDKVADLKDAFVKAGGECTEWTESNKVKIAQQSGECGTATVLSVYLSRDAVERRIETTKSSIFGDSGNDWLVGDNWIINTTDAVKLQDKLGGKIVSFKSK